MGIEHTGTTVWEGMQRIALKKPLQLGKIATYWAFLKKFFTDSELDLYFSIVFYSPVSLWQMESSASPFRNNYNPGYI